MLAVNPNDSKHLVIAASEITVDAPGNDRRWNYAYVSRDGGDTWQKARLPGGPGAGIGHPLFSATDLGDPVATFLPDGTVLFVGLATNLVAGLPATSPTLFVARSEDGGFTFPHVAVVARGTGLSFAPDYNDKPWIAAGPDGTALLVWTYASPANAGAHQMAVDPLPLELRWSHSTDGGRTWSRPATLAGGPGRHHNGARPLMASPDVWLVTSVEYPLRLAGGFDVYLSTTENRGASWETHVVASGASSRPDPKLHILPRADGSRLALVYAEDRGGLEAPAIQYSRDQGKTWAAAVPIDDSAFPVSALPESAVLDAGQVVIGYYVATADGRGEFRIAVVEGDRIQARLTMDAGIEFSQWFGDYIGLASTGAGVVGAWVTRRGSSSDLVAAALMEATVPQ